MFRSDDYRTVCEVLFRGVLSSLVYDSSNIPNDNSDSRRKLYIILLKNKETKINATLGVNFYTERFLCVFFFTISACFLRRRWQVTFATCIFCKFIDCYIGWNFNLTLGTGKLEDFLGKISTS
jgi:hypothetical protein